MEIMKHAESHSENFIYLQKMADIRSRIASARRTGATLGYRTAILFEFFVFESKSAFPRKEISVARISARHNAVKEVNSSMYCFKNIYRCSDTHKVSRLILWHKGLYRVYSFIHSACRFTDRKSAYAHSASFPGNMNCKVGIIGAGAIGKLVIQLLKPFQLEVLVFDPFLPDEKAVELGVKKVSLETIFSECQTISNHLANNEQTKGMLHYGLFSLMKPNATFINTGRGAQVDENALIQAMIDEPDRTAVLDVTFPEPPVEGSPLLTLPNIFMTPHIAGSLGKEVARMGKYMAIECEKTLAGQPTQYEVTLKMLETMA